MNFKLLFVYLLAAISSFPLLFSSEEIQVRLSTSTPLEPLYLGKIVCHDGSFSDKYLTKLHDVLHFDMNQNGKTQIMPFHPDKEALMVKDPAAFEVSKWQSWAAAYVLYAEIENQMLSVSCYNCSSYSVKTFTPVKLSGSLAKDRRVLHKLADAIFQAVWKEKGIANSKILYAVKTEKNRQVISEIWCCDIDGANPIQITSENSYCITPVLFSKETGQFLYVSYQSGVPKIFIAPFAGGKGRKLLELKGNQLLPCLSSKKDKIAFICDASGRADLFIADISIDGQEVSKPVQLFSYPRSTQASPTFSPDGKQVAFVSDKDGTPRIYILPTHYHLRRQSPILLSKKNKESSCPSWSPDGKKLAYSAKTEGVRQIWIYDFETKQEWQLTTGPMGKENPSWAPNSHHLVFNSIEGHLSDLYFVSLTQPEPVKIACGEGIKHYPSWIGK